MCSVPRACVQGKSLMLSNNLCLHECQSGALIMEADSKCCVRRFVSQILYFWDLKLLLHMGDQSKSCLPYQSFIFLGFHEDKQLKCG